MKLPPAHELLELFEAEPAVLDPGVPWANWSIDGRSIIHLEVDRVESVRIERDRAFESFVVSFNAAAALPDLIVQLKPFVKVHWGK